MQVVTVLETKRCNGSSVTVQVSANVSKMLVNSDQAKLAMCFYPIDDDVRLLQRCECCKFGRLAAHCRSTISVKLIWCNILN